MTTPFNFSLLFVNFQISQNSTQKKRRNFVFFCFFRPKKRILLNFNVFQGAYDTYYNNFISLHFPQSLIFQKLYSCIFSRRYFANLVVVFLKHKGGICAVSQAFASFVPFCWGCRFSTRLFSLVEKRYLMHVFLFVYSLVRFYAMFSHLLSVA